MIYFCFLVGYFIIYIRNILCVFLWEISYILFLIILLYRSGYILEYGVI